LKGRNFENYRENLRKALDTSCLVDNLARHEETFKGGPRWEEITGAKAGLP